MWLILVTASFVCIVALFMFRRHLRNQATAIIAALAEREWMALEELIALGCPEYHCRHCLPAMFEAGMLQICAREHLSENAWRIVQGEGFTKDTIEYHLFRLSDDNGIRRRAARLRANAMSSPAEA